jgi:hypothetical protein
MIAKTSKIFNLIKEVDNYFRHSFIDHFMRRFGCFCIKLYSGSFIDRSVRFVQDEIGKSFICRCLKVHRCNIELFVSSKVIGRSLDYSRGGLNFVQAPYSASYSNNLSKELIADSSRNKFVVISLIFLGALVANTVICLFFGELSLTNLSVRILLLLFVLFGVRGR